MSHQESTLPGHGKESALYTAAVSPPVALNELFKECLRKRSVLFEPSSVIVRCDQLPQVPASRASLMQLFDQLLYLILSTPSVGLRTFLYLDCEPQTEGGLLPKTPAFFRIRFHTNITAGESWRELHSELLNECSRLAQQSGGALTVNAIQNTGCLFSLLLPGKL